MRWIIYEIENLTTGKSYIGCTQNVARRLRAHKHYNPQFLGGRYRVRELARVKNRADASELEESFVRILGTIEPRGYNKRGGGFAGYKHEPKTLEKITKAARTRSWKNYSWKKTSEQIQKQRISLIEHYRTNKHPRTGKHHTLEAKKKIGKANRGNTYWLGRKHSETAKKKMSIAKKGRVPWNKGKPWSEAMKKKISESRKSR